MIYSNLQIISLVADYPHILNVLTVPEVISLVQLLHYNNRGS